MRRYLFLFLIFGVVRSQARTDVQEFSAKSVQISCESSILNSTYVITGAGRLVHEERMDAAKCRSLASKQRALVAQAANERRNVKVSIVTGDPFSTDNTPVLALGRVQTCAYADQKLIPACSFVKTIYARLNCKTRLGLNVTMNVLCTAAGTSLPTADQCFEQRVTLAQSRQSVTSPGERRRAK